MTSWAFLVVTVLAVIVFGGMDCSSAMCTPLQIELNDSQPVVLKPALRSTCAVFVKVTSLYVDCSCHWSIDSDLEPHVREKDARHVLLQPFGPFFSHRNITCHCFQADDIYHKLNNSYTFAIGDVHGGKSEDTPTADTTSHPTVEITSLTTPDTSSLSIADTVSHLANNTTSSPTNDTTSSPPNTTPGSPANNSTNGSASTPAGVIIAIVLGILLLLIGVALICLICRYRHILNNKPGNGNGPSGPDGPGGDGPDGDGPGGDGPDGDGPDGDAATELSEMPVESDQQEQHSLSGKVQKSAFHQQMVNCSHKGSKSAIGAIKQVSSPPNIRYRKNHEVIKNADQVEQVLQMDNNR